MLEKQQGRDYCGYSSDFAVSDGMPLEGSEQSHSAI